MKRLRDFGGEAKGDEEVDSLIDATSESEGFLIDDRVRRSVLSKTCQLREIKNIYSRA